MYPRTPLELTSFKPCSLLGYMVLFMAQADESGIPKPIMSTVTSQTVLVTERKPDAQARAARKACRHLFVR
jgi:hypothetical protein